MKMKFLIATFLLGVRAIGSVLCAAEPELAADGTPIDVDQAFEKINATIRTTRAGVQTAIATARFKCWYQEPKDTEPVEMTTGTVQLYFSEGKSLLRVAHDKRLRKVMIVPEGAKLIKNAGEPDQFRDEDGELLELDTQLIDNRPNNVFISSDGISSRSVVIFKNQEPTWTTFKEFSQACAEVGTALVDPIQLFQGICNLEAIEKNLGREAIRWTPLPDGGYRGCYRVKNAPRVRVEFDALAEDSLNISASRVFNEGQELPAAVDEAAWKKVNDQWVVWRRSRERRYQSRGYEKQVVTYYKLDINSSVDPSAFTRNAMTVEWKPRSHAVD
jgi:hypothetical protein